MPNDTPDSRPASWWEWSGFQSLLLAVLLWGQDQLNLWTNRPKWADLAIIGLPFAIRFIRERLLGALPVSYRRAA